MAKDRPLNILHLFSDQQRFDTIAALGNPLIKTPNLDRLVREGLAFTRAYSPSPECVPARSCMITGHYPGRTGCYCNAYDMPANAEQPSFMERLTQAGYRAHGIGKCHFTPDAYAGRGFSTREHQEEIPKRREDDDYARGLVEHGYDWLLEPHGIRGEMYYIPQPSVLPPHEHPTHWIGDRAVDFIQNADSDEPWYLYGSFIHPHPPFAPPVPWHKLYRAPDMPLPRLPEDKDDLTFFINRHQNRYKYRDNGGLDLNLVRCQRAYYYACISFIDQQVGRILNALEEAGQLDHTLILYSADHGEYLGDYGCFGKRGMHDVSARVPLLVRWPDGFQAGQRCESPASLVDLAPTFTQAAGLNVEDGQYDGVSLRDLADGTAGRERVYSQYHCGGDGLYMAVERDWKFIYSAPDQKEYLFDLRADPLETVNLATRQPDHPQLARLRKDCQTWIRGTGQTDEVSGEGQWKAYPVKQMPADLDENLIFQDPPWWDGKLPV
jgi:arylsulfatase A-like enzyme